MLSFKVVSNVAHENLVNSIVSDLRSNHMTTASKSRLNQLLALSFETSKAEKDFFLAVSTYYANLEILHQLTNNLAAICFEGQTINQQAVTTMLANSQVVTKFLAIELIRDNVGCAAHLQEGGVFYPAINPAAAVTSAFSSFSAFYSAAVTLSSVVTGKALVTTFAPLMPHIAPYLLDESAFNPAFGALEVATFKTNRSGAGEQISMLNSIDTYITKYLLAGLDEARKIQPDVNMGVDEAGKIVYRGRCKLLAALAIRHAIVVGKLSVDEMTPVLDAALQSNRFTRQDTFRGNFDEFMIGSNGSSYMMSENDARLVDLLEGCFNKLSAEKAATPHG